MNNATMRGRIIKGVGGLYTVLCNGQSYPCRASGRLRLGEQKPMSGDLVDIEPGVEEGYIVALAPRKNQLIRPAVANIDQLVILASEAPPQTDPYLIDKVLVIALYQGIAPLIVLNKADLSDSAQLYETYCRAGFDTLRVSAVTCEGIDALRERLAGKVSAFTGNSGIGKSSILTCVDPRFVPPVGEMSKRIARGKHTTRHVELFALQNGGLVADTPGFSTFEINQMERLQKTELQDYFPEMHEHIGTCRFSDCAHLQEPGCAVRALVAQGVMGQSRYDSYTKIYAEIAKRKDWEA